MSRITELLDEVDSALKKEFKPGVFKWIDENFDGAHKAAIDRFDAAIVAARGSPWFFKRMEVEAGIYRDTMLRMFREYKSTQANEWVGDLFDFLRSKADSRATV